MSDEHPLSELAVIVSWLAVFNLALWTSPQGSVFHAGVLIGGLILFVAGSLRTLFHSTYGEIQEDIEESQQKIFRKQRRREIINKLRDIQEDISNVNTDEEVDEMVAEVESVRIAIKGLE